MHVPTYNLQHTRIENLREVISFEQYMERHNYSLGQWNWGADVTDQTLWIGICAKYFIAIWDIKLASNDVSRSISLSQAVQVMPSSWECTLGDAMRQQLV